MCMKYVGMQHLLAAAAVQLTTGMSVIGIRCALGIPQQATKAQISKLQGRKGGQGVAVREACFQSSGGMLICD